MMPTRSRTQRCRSQVCFAGQGFTIMELLVAIGLINLLVVMLLVGLQHARESAIKTQCMMQNMRQIGLMDVGFSMDNRGRNVGRARSNASSISWHEILSLHSSNSMEYIRRISIYTGPIVCPAWGQDVPMGWRWVGMNTYACGDDNLPPNPSHGILGAPAPIPSGLNNATEYYLGATLESFQKPFAKFWLVETEHFDEIKAIWPGYGTTVDLNDDSTWPPYAANSGRFSFRHQLTNNVLFMDGHVQSVSPDSDDLNTNDHYIPN